MAAAQAKAAGAGIRQSADAQAADKAPLEPGKPAKRIKERHRPGAAGIDSDAAQPAAASEAAEVQPEAQREDAEQPPQPGSEGADFGDADASMQGAVLRQLLAGDKVAPPPRRQ